MTVLCPSPGLSVKSTIKKLGLYTSKSFNPTNQSSKAILQEMWSFLPIQNQCHPSNTIDVQLKPSTIASLIPDIYERVLSAVIHLIGNPLFGHSPEIWILLLYLLGHDLPSDPNLTMVNSDSIPQISPFKNRSLSSTNFVGLLDSVFATTQSLFQILLSSKKARTNSKKNRKATGNHLPSFATSSNSASNFIECHNQLYLFFSWICYPESSNLASLPFEKADLHTFFFQICGLAVENMAFSHHISKLAVLFITRLLSEFEINQALQAQISPIRKRWIQLFVQHIAPHLQWLQQVNKLETPAPYPHYSILHILRASDKPDTQEESQNAGENALLLLNTLFSKLFNSEPVLRDIFDCCTNTDLKITDFRKFQIPTTHQKAPAYLSTFFEWLWSCDTNLDGFGFCMYNLFEYYLKFLSEQVRGYSHSLETVQSLKHTSKKFKSRTHHTKRKKTNSVTQIDHHPLFLNVIFMLNDIVAFLSGSDSLQYGFEIFGHILYSFAAYSFLFFDPKQLSFRWVHDILFYYIHAIFLEQKTCWSFPLLQVLLDIRYTLFFHCDSPTHEKKTRVPAAATKAGLQPAHTSPPFSRYLSIFLRYPIPETKIVQSSFLKFHTSIWKVASKARYFDAFIPWILDLPPLVLNNPQTTHSIYSWFPEFQISFDAPFASYPSGSLMIENLISTFDTLLSKYTPASNQSSNSTKTSSILKPPLFLFSLLHSFLSNTQFQNCCPETSHLIQNGNLTITHPDISIPILLNFIKKNLKFIKLHHLSFKSMHPETKTIMYSLYAKSIIMYNFYSPTPLNISNNSPIVLNNIQSLSYPNNIIIDLLVNHKIDVYIKCLDKLFVAPTPSTLSESHKLFQVAEFSSKILQPKFSLLDFSILHFPFLMKLSNQQQSVTILSKFLHYMSLPQPQSQFPSDFFESDNFLIHQWSHLIFPLFLKMSLELFLVDDPWISSGAQIGLDCLKRFIPFDGQSKTTNIKQDQLFLAQIHQRLATWKLGRFNRRDSKPPVLCKIFHCLIIISRWLTYDSHHLQSAASSFGPTCGFVSFLFCALSTIFDFHDCITVHHGQFLTDPSQGVEIHKSVMEMVRRRQIKIPRSAWMNWILETLYSRSTFFYSPTFLPPTQFLWMWGVPFLFEFAQILFESYCSAYWAIALFCNIFVSSKNTAFKDNLASLILKNISTTSLPPTVEDTKSLQTFVVSNCLSDNLLTGTANPSGISDFVNKLGLGVDKINQFLSQVRPEATTLWSTTGIQMIQNIFDFIKTIKSYRFPYPISNAPEKIPLSTLENLFLSSNRHSWFDSTRSSLVSTFSLYLAQHKCELKITISGYFDLLFQEIPLFKLVSQSKPEDINDSAFFTKLALYSESFNLLLTLLKHDPEFLYDKETFKQVFHQISNIFFKYPFKCHYLLNTIVLYLETLQNESAQAYFVTNLLKQFETHEIKFDDSHSKGFIKFFKLFKRLERNPDHKFLFHSVFKLVPDLDENHFQITKKVIDLILQDSNMMLNRKGKSKNNISMTNYMRQSIQCITKVLQQSCDLVLSNKQVDPCLNMFISLLSISFGGIEWISETEFTSLMTCYVQVITDAKLDETRRFLIYQGLGLCLKNHKNLLSKNSPTLVVLLKNGMAYLYQNQKKSTHLRTVLQFNRVWESLLKNGFMKRSVPFLLRHLIQTIDTQSNISDLGLEFLDAVGHLFAAGDSKTYDFVISSLTIRQQGIANMLQTWFHENRRYNG